MEQLPSPAGIACPCTWTPCSNSLQFPRAKGPVENKSSSFQKSASAMWHNGRGKSQTFLNDKLHMLLRTSSTVQKTEGLVEHECGYAHTFLQQRNNKLNLLCKPKALSQASGGEACEVWAQAGHVHSYLHLHSHEMCMYICRNKSICMFVCV